MKLVSVCVGRTQNLRIRDQNVTTAFLKGPVERPVRVSANGLEGNDVAVHTDAVYAIAEEHYGHWAEQLGRDVADWPHGLFGVRLSANSRNPQVPDGARYWSRRLMVSWALPS